MRLIAIDGFDPSLFDTLSAAGELPALTSALRGAGRAPRPDDEDAAAGRRRSGAAVDHHRDRAAGQRARRAKPRDATGRRACAASCTPATIRPPARLLGVSTDLLRLTRPAVASGTERQREDVLGGGRRRRAAHGRSSTGGRRGRRVSTNGVVLSDRATLRLEHGGPLDAEIAPAALYQRLQARWPALRDQRRSAGRGGAGTACAGRRRPAAMLRRSAELDAMALVLAGAVSEPTHRPGRGLPAGPRHRAARAAGHDARLAVGIGGLGAARASSAITSRSTRCVSGRSDRGLRRNRDGGHRAGTRGDCGREGRLRSAAAATNAAPRDRASATDVARHGALCAGRAGQPSAQPARPLVEPVRRPCVHRATGAPRDHLRPRRAAALAARNGQPLDQEMIERLRSLGYVR